MNFSWYPTWFCPHVENNAGKRCAAAFSPQQYLEFQECCQYVRMHQLLVLARVEWDGTGITLTRLHPHPHPQHLHYAIASTHCPHNTLLVHHCMPTVNPPPRQDTHTPSGAPSALFAQHWLLPPLIKAPVPASSSQWPAHHGADSA